MKVDLYMDVWKNMMPDNVTASTRPYVPQSPGTKRYKITVEIPDEDIFGVSTPLEVLEMKDATNN